MNVTFEHPVIIFDDKIADILIGFINHLMIAYDEDTLRRLVADYAERTEFDRYFAHGYGKHHLWVAQRKITDPVKVFDYRILIVEY